MRLGSSSSVSRTPDVRNGLEGLVITSLRQIENLEKSDERGILLLIGLQNEASNVVASWKSLVYDTIHLVGQSLLRRGRTAGKLVSHG